MQFDVNEIEFGKPQITAVIAIATSIFVWTYFFGTTGISVNDLFTFKIDILLGKLLSLSFLLFLATFPLTPAIIAAFAKDMKKINLHLYSLLATLVALTIAMIAFPTIQGFWLPGLFYIISIPVLIETAYLKYAELKSFVSMRTMMAATGKTIMLLGLSLFILSAVTILPQQDKFIEKFEETFIENIFQGFTTGENQQQLTGSVVDIMVENQQQTAEMMLNNPAFDKLREKTDPDVMTFVFAADAMQEQLNSSAYRDELAKQFGTGAAQASRDIDIIGMLKQQLPFIETFESILWLLHGFAMASFFLLAGNIIFKPLAALYGMIAVTLLTFLFTPLVKTKE